MTRALCVSVALGLTACDKPRPPAETFTISVPYAIESLDPHARDMSGQLVVCAHFYDALVRRDRDQRMTPSLALGWFSPTPLIWVFQLRPGVRFQDGREMEAADVVATFERLRTHPELEMAVDANDIETVRELGPREVELRTRRPLANLLNKLSQVFVIPRDAGPELAQQPRGTGPYRLQARSASGDLELVAFPGHWAGRPPLERVRLRLDRTPEESLQDLLAGTSQLAQLGSSAAERALVGRSDMAVHRQTGLFLKYLGFDLARDVTPYVSTPRNPFRDLRVRRAMALAVDRRRLVERLPTPALPSAQLVPPSIFGFDPQRPLPPADPDRARALLAEAGYPEGFEATLHSRQFGGGESAEPLREMLAGVGIRLDVVQLGEAAFRRAIREPPSLFLTRYACDTGDASDVLNAVIHRLDAKRGYGYSNFGRYADTKVDAAIEASAGEENRDVRLRALQQILDQAVDDALVIPLYVDQNVFGLRRGWAWSPRADGLVLAWEIKPQQEGTR